MGRCRGGHLDSKFLATRLGGGPVSILGRVKTLTRIELALGLIKIPKNSALSYVSNFRVPSHNHPPATDDSPGEARRQGSHVAVALGIRWIRRIAERDTGPRHPRRTPECSRNHQHPIDDFREGESQNPRPRLIPTPLLRGDRKPQHRSEPTRPAIYAHDHIGSWDQQMSPPPADPMPRSPPQPG